MKYFRPKYDRDPGDFLSIYETIGFLVLRGDPFEAFLSYGYDPSKSKVLYLNFRRKIPISSSGTMFNRHKVIVESAVVNLDMSRLLFFFLPSITDRSEEIKEYLKNVSITPLDVTKNS